jgi:hypothetical protein
VENFSLDLLHHVRRRLAAVPAQHGIGRATARSHRLEILLLLVLLVVLRVVKLLVLRRLLLMCVGVNEPTR